MKKRLALKGLLFPLVLIFFIFTACGQHEEDEFASSETFLTSQDQILLRQNIFAGEGSMSLAGGDGGIWFYWVFGFDYNFIPSHIILDIVGADSFSRWREEFYPHGSRNIREVTLRTLLEDFGITMEELIRVHERTYGLPMAEIDSLVRRARNIDTSTLSDDEAWELAKWEVHVLTSADIEALFSNDVSKIWASFPGYGIYYNGRAYSPEWILHNIERAVLEEQLPIDEIERVINFAAHHHLLTEVVSAAKAELQSAMNAMRDIVND